MQPAPPRGCSWDETSYDSSSRSLPDFVNPFAAHRPSVKPTGAHADGLPQVFRSTLAGPALPLVPQGLFLQTAAHAIGASTQGFGHLFWNCPQMPSPQKCTAHLHARPQGQHALADASAFKASAGEVPTPGACLGKGRPTVSLFKPPLSSPTPAPSLRPTHLPAAAGHEPAASLLATSRTSRATSVPAAALPSPAHCLSHAADLLWAQDHSSEEHMLRTQSNPLRGSAGGAGPVIRDSADLEKFWKDTIDSVVLEAASLATHNVNTRTASVGSQDSLVSARTSAEPPHRAAAGQTAYTALPPYSLPAAPPLVINQTPLPDTVHPTSAMAAVWSPAAAPWISLDIPAAQQDGMKLPSLPSLGLQLPLDEDDLSLEDGDLLAEEPKAPAPPALQGAAGLPPAEPLAKASCAAAVPAPRTSNSAAPKPETLAAQVEEAPKEPVQLEDSSCCCTATAMEEEVQISEASDTAGASEDERSPPQSAHSGKRNGRGSAARASVIRNRVIQKQYLQRKKDQRTALLESVMDLEAQRAELRAEMQPLWARHQSLTRSLPPCLQQEELRYLASLSCVQRRLYEADVKPLVLQLYCQAPLAAYEALLAPPLTTHEHHLVSEMLLPASRACTATSTAPAAALDDLSELPVKIMGELALRQAQVEKLSAVGQCVLQTLDPLRSKCSAQLRELLTALASPVLALCNTQRSVALVGQLCTDLDLLAASCQAMEEQARLKLAEVLTARQGAKLRRMTKGHNGVHAALCAQVNYSHCEESSSMVSEAGADPQAEHQRKAVTAVAKQPMKAMAKDPPCASDAPLGPQRKDAAQVAWAGQGSDMLGRPLDRPTSCPPGARSPAARPCSPDVGGPRGNLPRTGSLAGHVMALTLHGKRPSPELAADHVMDARRFEMSQGPTLPWRSALLTHPGSPSSVTDDWRPAKRHSRPRKYVSVSPLS
ncbi:hypothetical protein CVIRNUC_000102 [Coccomyxa viridis]|uniref:BZIP domain-containing protein n=1 Tax=Coccomyxa viridis TaxID=1274662 RepID=A0AAV1HPA0_9CHLO|nr:hypothetical protein CVIRNUC_000102 [Coccomyxa viridis]